MKIRVDEQGHIVLSEVYEPIVIETASGEKAVICEQDEKIKFGLRSPNGDEVDYTKIMLRNPYGSVFRGWDLKERSG